MRAGDIMTREVVSVKRDTGLDRATAIMLERHISGLPVLDEKGHLAGIVTEGDLLRRGELGTERRRPRWLHFLVSPGRLAEEYAHARGRRVYEVMTPDVVAATEATELQDLVELMLRHDVKRVPIVAGHQLVGIVTRADIMLALSESWRHSSNAPVRDNAAILKDIQQAFAQSDCIPTQLVAASVHDGSVELRGCITDERERTAVRVAVENVPGVKSIHDHMIWVETMSGFAFASPEDEVAERAHESPGLIRLVG